MKKIDPAAIVALGRWFRTGSKSGRTPHEFPAELLMPALESITVLSEKDSGDFMLGGYVLGTTQYLVNVGSLESLITGLMIADFHGGSPGREEP